jgi:hypothetical protein
MNQDTLNLGMKAGTAGGVVCTILVNLGNDVVYQAATTASGAIVSFAVSLALKWLFGRLKRK